MKSKFLFLSVFFLSISFAQEKTGVLAETDDVKIEAKELVCKSMQGFDLLFQGLEFTNKTAEEINITYNFEVWHSDICQTCGGDHGSIRNITIPASSTIEATCKDIYNSDLTVLDHSLTDNPAAPKVKLTEIVINKITKD